MSTRKGKKGQKNIPVLYSEIKERHTIVITPTGWEKLHRLAQKKELSISEYIEQWVRKTPD